MRTVEGMRIGLGKAACTVVLACIGLTSGGAGVWPVDTGLSGKRLVTTGAGTTAGAADTAEEQPGASARGKFGTGFEWPLHPPRPTRPFIPPTDPYGPGHRGVDLAGSVGQPVLAAGEGRVVFAGQLVDRPLVSIEHANGLRTTYEPVRPTVVNGERVARGHPIGQLEPGHAGCSRATTAHRATVERAAVERATACLHWGVRRDERYLDPLRLVGRVQLRLLPWDGR